MYDKLITEIVLLVRVGGILLLFAIGARINYVTDCFYKFLMAE